MQTVLSGFNQPVKITFIPDNGYGVDGSGNAFVSQRAGSVIVMKYTGGQFVKQSVPFVTVPNVFSSFYEEGLAGIAFPPDYNTSHFVYFYAAVQFANGTHVIQVMRYTATTDGSQNIVAVPGSQKIILVIPDLGIGHFGGHIKFDSLGNLYIGAGDQWTFGASASLQTLKGKLLRITPLATPGPDGKYYSIPSTNPFASSSDPSIMKEIFSYGLRHPFSFDLDSVTGKLYVDDVGLDTTEEIDDSTVAKNFGWGTYEGPVLGNPQNLVNYKNPTYYYYHADVEAPGGGFVAITAGVFYDGDVYPSQFKGAYFFGDYGVGFIKALLPVEQYPPTIDPATGVLIGHVVPITSGHPNNPVGLAVWHGEVYYTDYNGNIGKLTFS
jgi:glucose/arabinose dehydrogenase